MRGELSYASQEAWVFSGTIRENILFGAEMDEERYWAVVDACALRADMETWQYGDRTLVGQRGMALSGGQKVVLINSLIQSNKI